MMPQHRWSRPSRAAFCVFVLVAYAGMALYASETRSVHYSFSAQSATSDQMISGLSVHEVTENEDVSQVFVLGPQGLRLVTTLGNSGTKGLRLLKVLDDASGWWIAFSFDFGVRDLSLHRFLRSVHASQDVRMQTSSGLSFTVREIPSNEHCIDVFLRRLEASSVYDELVSEIPGSASELSRILLQVDRQDEQPESTVFNLAAGFLEILAWPLEEAEEPTARWELSVGEYQRGHDVSAELRSFLALFGSAKSEDPLLGEHVDEVLTTLADSLANR